MRTMLRRRLPTGLVLAALAMTLGSCNTISVHDCPQFASTGGGTVMGAGVELAVASAVAVASGCVGLP
jgi:hypothetical protein